MTITESDRVIHILEHAHRRMDLLGYPAAHRTIDGRESADIAHTFDRLAGTSEARAALTAGPRDREPQEAHR